MQSINEIGHLASFKPSRSVNDLKINQPYIYRNVKKVATKFGDRIVCEFETFSVFLPERFAKLTQEQIATLNGGNVGIIFRGTKNMSGGRESANLVEFKVITEGTPEYQAAIEAPELLVPKESDTSSNVGKQ